MKQKLKKFKAYSDSLLPYETDYLLQKQKMVDATRLSILKTVAYNSKYFSQLKPYDYTIDKRTYSHLFKWMQKELKAINVDKGLEWINEVHEEVLKDNITSEQERVLLKSLNNYNKTSFYFVKYYHLLIDYRHFLLIRMRYNDYKLVDHFIVTNKPFYDNSIVTNEKIHKITYDIVGASNQEAGESLKWLKWLQDTYMNVSIDGLNRYMALIRMSFVSIKYNQVEQLKDTFLSSESFFSEGKNYSKRLLLNYYDLMLVIFDKLGNYDQAVYYGYLSIKDVNINPDSIIYVNNLANVLIKNQNYEEALELFNHVDFKLNNNKNFHASIGFVSNQIRCLSKTGKSREAIIKGRVFLNAYRNKIVKFRWHRFFAAYLGAMLIENKHSEIIQHVKKNKLLKLKSNSSSNEKTSNIIEIYYCISLYEEGILKKSKLLEALDKLLMSDTYQLETVDKELLDYIEHL